jgi:hypothetical protein
MISNAEMQFPRVGKPVNNRGARWLSFLLLTLAIPAFSQSGGAVQVVDGYRLYFGIVPSALLRGRNVPHVGSDEDAHGQPRADYRSEHHLLVAIFEAASGKRIENAGVTARVPISGSTVSQPMEPMRIGDTITFGNVFVLPAGNRYTFEVRIVIAGRPKPVIARFVYDDLHGSLR